VKVVTSTGEGDEEQLFKEGDRAKALTLDFNLALAILR